MLARAPQPTVRADAAALPFPDASYGSVALLYVLYHLPEPARACAEAHRVLRQGRLVAVAAPSRHELAHALPRTPLTFDAELAPELLAELFVEVEVERWDAPLLEFPTRGAVRDHVIGKGVERRVPEVKAETVSVPCGSGSGGAGVRAQDLIGRTRRRCQPWPRPCWIQPRTAA